MINYCQQVIPKDTFLVVNTKLEKSSRFKRELRNNSSICKNKLLNICHIHNESPSISCPWTGSPGTHCPFGLRLQKRLHCHIKGRHPETSKLVIF